MYIVAQIVGVLAVVCYLLSYQFKKRPHIVLVNSMSSALYVIQYILLGAFEGAVMDIISTISSVAAKNKEKRFIAKYVKVIIIIVNILLFAVGLVFYKNIFSFFPVFGAMLQVSALWITDEKKIRLISFIGVPFWLIYNLISQAYTATLGSALCMLSLGTAIYRYDIKGEINAK